MNEDGLGTLVVLPREVRDMIYSYVVASLVLTGSWCTESYRNVVTISKQLCRELLESFLRNNDAFEIYHKDRVIKEFLHDTSPFVDIATYTKAIGTAIRSNMFKKYDERRKDYNISQSQYPDESSYIFKGVQKLRSYHRAYGIPSHKLHITMKYALPYGGSCSVRNQQFTMVYQTILWGYDRVREVRIHPESKSRSLAALEDVKTTMLLDMEKLIDVHIEKIKTAERGGRKDTGGIWLQDRCNMIMPAILSAMREYHEKVIDQVVQIWREADEFDEYCLGDFFALAEEW